MTADQLREAQRAVEELQTRTRVAEEYRNCRIREALADGWTHAQVAEATGLSRGRISQI